MSYPPGPESSSSPPEQPSYSPPPAYPPAAPEQPSYSPPPAYPPAPANPPAPAYQPESAYPPPAYGTAPTAQMPPVPTQPMPPTYDPAAFAAAQYSAPPVSGPYGYAPMGLPPAPPKKGGGAMTVVLSVLITVFVLASGGLGTLFVMKNREASNLSGQVTTLTSTVDSTQKELETTKRNLRDSDDKLDEVTRQKDALADCVTAIYAWLDAWAVSGGVETPATDAADEEFDRLCDIAEKYRAPR